MSSYYERVIGNLMSSEIAKSEDIHSIQTNIQSALQDSYKDFFGDGCILDDDEEALKLTPTPSHIDQQNKNYNDDENFISFYDRYLRQKIVTEKSEIQSIHIEARNDTLLSPTIFAEIRDSNMNLLKESNTTLESTVNDESPTTVEFIFNLKHLPIGEYYFVLRPVDITTVDLAQNGDETIYDTIDASSFTVRFDKGGNYNESLDASYNGVDYLESRMLEDQVIYEGGLIEIHNNNFDLFFEQIYSSGNTYVINPAPCLVMGQKTYPVDTHVTIDGPSKIGNRIDLVSLTTDGLLKVVSGLPFTGKAKKSDYPINTLGFKIAYITTYQNSDAYWTCPVCGTINDGNIYSCHVCDTTTNNRIPLIEQDDDNNITRRRDFLERLRRLENKLNYQIQNNSPSRIKTYIGTDPTMAIDQKEVEGTYKVSAATNINGENVISFDDDTKETYAWSIVDKKTITTSTETNVIAEMSANNVSIPQNKPKTIKDTDYYNLSVKEKNTTTTSNITTNDNNTTTTSYDSNDDTEESGVSDLKINIYIKDKTGKTLINITDKKTNTAGIIKLNIWSYNLKAGQYKIIAEYSGQKLSNDLNIYATGNYTTNSKTNKIDITISESKKQSTFVNIDAKTIPGNDSFYTNNMDVDTEIGEVRISKIKNSNPQKTTWTTVTDKEIKDLRYSNQSFTIKSSTTSQQSTYGMLNFDIKNDCTLYSITPYIEKFTNIEKYKIVLFKNDKVFNLDASRSSYIKEIATDKAKNTSFPNIYESDWYEPTGTKDGDGLKPQTYTFKFEDNPIELEKGTYSLVILGTLKDKDKDGIITIKQYHISDIGYGSASKVKGTYNPTRIFIEKNSLTNRTWKLEMSIYVAQYNTTGTLISKTIDTVNNIQSCTITTNYEIPPTCDIETYVSNNGGRTYIPIGNETNTATFVGLGHEFRWRVVFHGTGSITPKLKFNSDLNMKCAIKFELSEVENYIGYEDYGRCFASPIMNANYIGWSGTGDLHAKNIFEEWEFFRIWMEDENLSSTIDICSAYDYDNYTLNANSNIDQWPTTIFFSQIISNLNLSDFSQDSIDYDNYNASVEYDENNFRFIVDSNALGLEKEILTTPLAALTPGQYNYSYGDITNEDIDMSTFDYGLMDIETIYSDNYDDDDDDDTIDSQMRYAGVYTLIGPYYQALYNPNTEDNICWASDSDSDYDPNACIIGVSFDNGLEIKDEYTSLTLDIFPNLRDCIESDATIGKLEIDQTNKARLNTSVADNTKYQDEDGYFYIPANTLEIVVSLNPYGLIEDGNATYGKAYPITVPLRSCKFTTVSLNLSDLYGSTIYSIGIRVSTAKDIYGNYLVKWDGDKHPSLHKGDILGLGNIQWKGLNTMRYAPYPYTGDTSRWDWESMQKNQESHAYLLHQTNNVEGNSELLWTKFPLTRDQDNDITWYTQKQNTTLIEYRKNTGWRQERKEGYNKIKILDTDNKVVKMSNDNATSIVFELNSADEPANLFKVNTDINLIPYDWIVIKYRMEHIKTEPVNNDNKNTYFQTGSQMFKGEVIFDLYDTTNITNAEPIESLALPAWGKVQEKYGCGQTEYVNKRVHTWFKKHTNASQVKCIVLHTENPTKRTNKGDINLIIDDILFVNTTGISSFGPQLHARIYPKNMNKYTNTKIRKIGGVFRVR